MRLAGALVFAAMLAPASAFAQSAQEKAIAEELFNAAKKAYDAGNYAEACTKFADSQKLDPGIGTALYLGGCLERQGRIASAKQAFLDAKILADKLGDTKRSAVAKDHAEALRPTTVQIVIDKPIAGLEVRRDGSLATLGTVEPIDGGPHEITAVAPDRKKFSKVVDAPKDKGALVVKLELVSLEGPEPVIPPAPPVFERPPEEKPEPKPRSGGSGLRVAGIVIGAVGLVGIGLGAITGAKAIADFDASNDPQQGQCDPKGDACMRQRGVDLRASANMFGAVSTVSFIAGGVLLAGGVALFVFAPRPNVQVSAGPASLFVTGTF